MKKTKTKLSFDRQSIRLLTSSLADVSGGGPTGGGKQTETRESLAWTQCITHCLTCPITPAPTAVCTTVNH
jgi:hypothetical protein